MKKIKYYTHSKTDERNILLFILKRRKKNLNMQYAEEKKMSTKF